MHIDATAVVFSDGSVVPAGNARERMTASTEPSGGTAQCADLDGDGIIGIVALTVDFEQVGNPDRPVRAKAEFVLDDEADLRGAYPVRVFWNDEPVGEDVPWLLSIRAVPPHPPTGLPR